MYIDSHNMVYLVGSVNLYSEITEKIIPVVCDKNYRLPKYYSFYPKKGSLASQAIDCILVTTLAVNK